MFELVLVDDETWALSGLCELLDWEEYGFHIAGVCTDSGEARQLIRRLKPDAVFTDIRMPGISGLDLIRTLRNEGNAAQFVLISAYRDFEAAQRAITYEVCQYVLKPYDPDEVAQALLRLGEKLREAQEGAVVLHPECPEKMRDPVTERFLKNAAPYAACCLALLDSPSRELPLVAGVQCTPGEISGLPSARLLSFKGRFGAEAGIGADQTDPADSVGYSRIYPDFASLEKMTQEALFSLSGGFFWAENAQAADIQFFLCTHTGENLSLQQIAARFYLTESYLSGAFKKHTGRTVTAFIQDTRMWAAARALCRTDEDLRTVAAKCGYADYSYFGRLFKKRFGQSPEQYRASVRAGGRR